MKATTVTVLVALLVALAGAAPTLAQGSSETPGFQGVDRVPEEPLGRGPGFEGLVGRAPTADRGADMLASLGGEVSQEQVLKLVQTLEARLAKGETLAGEPDAELRRQYEVWTRAVSRAYVSVGAGDPLSTQDAEQFTDSPVLDKQFSELLTAVVDRDVSVETKKSGYVNPAEYAWVAQRYQALMADAVEYDTLIFLRKSGGAIDAAQTEAMLQGVRQRIAARAAELKKTF